ncbi:hypothetical protein E4K10_46320 [Streptomyces sp. T1317-0309]|nr:hypothetical protein E4K10_46320 [Streptomyces sp. T1317-0309]
MALLFTVAPAQANSSSPSPAAQAAAVVEKATGTADLADPSPARGAAAQAVTESQGGRITVTAPASTAGAVTSETQGGDVASIGLPATHDVQGTEEGNGTIVYLNAARSTDLAVQPTSDGGVRTLVTLKDSRANTEQRFQLTLPEGSQLVHDSDGGYEIVKEIADGSFLTVGIVEAPWAKDANGKPVPTHYEVSGNTLIQKIDTTADTAFPVVADPKYTWGG